MGPTKFVTRCNPSCLIFCVMRRISRTMRRVVSCCVVHVMPCIVQLTSYIVTASDLHVSCRIATVDIIHWKEVKHRPLRIMFGWGDKIG